MIEKYFIPGLLVKWSAPAGSVNFDGQIILSPNVQADPMICDGVGYLFNAMSPSLSSLGLTKGKTIPYKWLVYSEGQTTKRMLAAGDVLTGFMSGCCIATWTDGGRWVGHIGTTNARPEVNTILKRNFLSRMPRDTAGFFPAEAWPEAPQKAMDVMNAMKIMKEPLTSVVPRIVALVTTGGEFYSILLLQLGGPVVGQATLYCVGGIKKIAPIGYMALRGRLGGITIGRRN